MRSSPYSPPEILVDSHCHILPVRLATKIRQYFVTAGLTSHHHLTPCCIAPPSKEGDGPLLMYPVDPKVLVEVLIQESGMENAGTMWTLPYAHSAGMSVQLNADILSLAIGLSGDRCRIVPGLTVHPGDGEGDKGGFLKPEEVAELAVRNGARVAKLHCSVGNYSVLDKRMIRFWQLVQGFRLPVVIHAGASTAGTTASDDLDDIDKLCTLYPQAIIILAHAGHPNTARAFDLIHLHSSLYLDTTPVISSLPTLPPPLSAFSPSSPFSPSPTSSLTPHSHLLHLALQGRILFGTDSPTTAITRTDAALGVRDWIRSCVSLSMGSLRMEDVGGEMERLAERAEKYVLGEAAMKLEKGVRGVLEVKEELGWPEVDFNRGSGSGSSISRL